MHDLENSVVMILGASGNLGQACVQSFRVRGARLVLVDRSGEALEAAYSETDPDGLALMGDVDLTDEEAASRLVGTVNDSFGRIDALINTVGAFRGGQPVQDEPVETWDMLFSVNLFVALEACRAVIPSMRGNRAGRIVNIVSRHALKGAPDYAAYSAAKAALLRFSEAMAGELKDHGVTVNCVIPGTIDTPQNRAAMPEADTSRWVSTSAIADVIAFLASDAARAVTGAAIPVYGKG